MPLIKSGSKAAIGTNIAEMEAAGHPRNQSIAAALSTARRYAKAIGGRVGLAWGGTPSPGGMTHAHVPMGAHFGERLGRSGAMEHHNPLSGMPHMVDAGMHGMGTPRMGFASGGSDTVAAAADADREDEGRAWQPGRETSAGFLPDLSNTPFFGQKGPKAGLNELLRSTREEPSLPAMLSGVPSVLRGSKKIADSVGTDDPYHLNKLAGAAEIATGAMPGLSMTRAGAPLVNAAFATAPRIGLSGAILGAPEFAQAAMADTPAESRAKEMDHLNGVIATAAAKVKEIGQQKFNGKFEEAEASRKAARQPYLDAIGRANQRISALQAAGDAEAQEKEMRGAPLRESLPPVLSKTVPIWTSILGGMATRGIFNKYNAEYNDAINAYRAAEAAGNPAEMALRKGQISQLEQNTPWKNPTTYLAAGLPLELRGAEQLIDMRSPPDTRAYKEANARQHDPYAVAQDIGSGLFSSGTALGLGAKYSKNQPPRGLGRAIASGSAYEDAPALASQYGTALQAGEDLRALQPSSPESSPGLLQRLFGTRPGIASPVQAPIAQKAEGPIPLAASDVGEAAQRPRLLERIGLSPIPESAIAEAEAQNRRLLPAPAAQPNQSKPKASSAPSAPDWRIEPPEGAPPLPKGYHWHQRADGTQQPKNEDTGHWGALPTYTPPKGANGKNNGKALTSNQGNGAGTDEEIAGTLNGVPVIKKPAKEPGGDLGFKKGGAIPHPAMAVARRYAAGGAARHEPIVTGAIGGDSGGREDALPVSVPSGSYIIPADIVSGLGTGNTSSGFRTLEKMFGKSDPHLAAAQGGTVPIKISSGEFCVSPEQVAKLGKGDLDQGHRILDALVLKLRKEHVRQLSSLPAPSR